MAWLPRNEFRSPMTTSTIAAPKEHRRSRRNAAAASQSQTNSNRTLQSQHVLPRLWDTACGTFISQSFSKKRLFSEPKRKLLLPISDEEAVKRRVGSDDAGTSSMYPIFASQLSPVSEIVKNARSGLAASPPGFNDPRLFSDDNDVKFSPNIARLRFANALRKSAESRRRRRKKAKKEEKETPQGTQEFLVQPSRSRSRSASSESIIRGWDLSSSSDDSSSLFSRRVEPAQNSEWSP